MNKVGSLLQSTRESKGLSVDDVAQKTKIQKIYLDAIEQGNFSFFQNQEFYQQVFVGRYAEFLGLNKGEVLSDLHDDLTIAEQPKVSETVEPKVEAEVKETEDIVVKDAIDDNQITAETILDSVKKPRLDEADSQEITQLIEQINQNDSSIPKTEVIDDIDVKIDEKFKDLDHEPIVPEYDDHVEQNNSILDQIAQINKEASEKSAEEVSAADEPIAANIQGIYQIDSSPLESTAVIDLTSGIELETLKNQQATTTEEEPLHQTMLNTLNTDEEVIEQADDIAIPSASVEGQPAEQRPVQDTTTDAKDQPAKDITIAEAAQQHDAMGIDELERKLHTATSMNILNPDPNKTAMDLKVSKALGDNKAVMDDDIKKKIKKDKIINTLLIILIIILVVYFIYQIFFA